MDFILRPWKESDAKTLARHLNNKKIWDNCRDGLPFPYTCLLYTSPSPRD